MDPKATLIDLLESIAARDMEGAQEYLDVLAYWINHSGYVPSEIHEALDALRFS